MVYLINNLLLLKRFDNNYKSLLRKLKIEIDLYDRCVDDVTEALVALDPGVRFDSEKMKFVEIKELEESDENVDGAKRTMNELKKVANTIYECVQFTDDCPSNHVSGKMPVLNLQLSVGEEGQIQFEFYQKPMACKFVIPYGSAHSKKMKLSVMVEEGVRRLRNHYRGMEWERKRKVTEEWSRKLWRSGYPHSFRHQVIKSAVRKWEDMCKVEDEGGRPIYRSGVWHRSSRRPRPSLRPPNFRSHIRKTHG